MESFATRGGTETIKYPQYTLVMVIESAGEPFSQAELLYEALQGVNADVTLVEVEDGNHGFWEAGQPYPREPLPPLLRHWIVQFLQKYLCSQVGFPLRDRQTVCVSQLRTLAAQ